MGASQPPEVGVKITAKDETGAAATSAKRSIGLLEIEARKLNDAMDAEKAKTFGKAIDGIKAPVSGLSGVMSTLSGHWGALLGVLGGGTMFGAAVDATMEWTGSVVQLSKRLGITTEEASGLNVALHHIGMSVDDYGAVAQKMTKQLRTNEDGFRSLGIATKDQNGEWRNSQSVMADAIERLNGMQAGTDRNIASQTLFGARVGNLTGLLRLNTDMLRESAEKAEQYHLVVGPDGAAKVRAYKDSMADLRLIGTSLSVQMGNGLLPVLIKIGTYMGENAPTFSKVFSAVLQGVQLLVIEFGGELQQIVFEWDNFVEHMSIGARMTDAAFTRLLHGDFSGAKAAFTSGFAEMRAQSDLTRKAISENEREMEKAKLDVFAPAKVGKAPSGDTLGGDDLKAGKDAHKEYLKQLKDEVDQYGKLATFGALRVTDLQHIWDIEQKLAALRKSGTVEERAFASEELSKTRKIDPFATAPKIQQTAGPGQPGPMAIVTQAQIGAQYPGAMAVHQEATFMGTLGKMWDDHLKQLRDANGEYQSLGSNLAEIVDGPITDFAQSSTMALGALIVGSKTAGAAFKASMANAIASVARMEGDYFVGKAIAAAGDALLGNPLAILAHSNYLLAAGAMYAVSGGASALASGGSGGAGGGGAGASFQSSADQAQTNVAARGSLTVRFPTSGKSVLDLRDPQDRDLISSFIRDLAGDRDVVLDGGI